MPQPGAPSRISPEWARDWAEQYLAAHNSHVLGRLLGHLTDDVTYVHARLPGGVAHGKAAISEFLVGLWTAFTDIAFEAAGEPFVSADGARMAVAWKGTGTFTGPYAGLEPTGRQFVVTGIDVFDFEGNLARRIETVTDTISLLRQIGAVPAPTSSAH